jgi:MtN3 and saliva related transmembrane protein
MGRPKMDITTIIGSAAGILTATSLLPQVIKAWRSKSTRDVSTPMLVVLATGVFLWFVYGLRVDSMPIIVANVVTFTFACTVLVLNIKNR